MAPKQALVALILLSIEFNRKIYIINNKNLSFSLLLAIISLASSIQKPLCHYFTKWCPVCDLNERKRTYFSKKKFKANYPLDDACFILDYCGCNKSFLYGPDALDS